MGGLRTAEAQETYHAHLRTLDLERHCPLCAKESLVEFAHWRIVMNRFPYDRIAATHHMLLSKRHCTEPELTDDERAELRTIKYGYCNEHYDSILESTHRSLSLTRHYHLHLLVIT